MAERDWAAFEAAEAVRRAAFGLDLRNPQTPGPIRLGGVLLGLRVLGRGVVPTGVELGEDAATLSGRTYARSTGAESERLRAQGVSSVQETPLSAN